MAANSHLLFKIFLRKVHFNFGHLPRQAVNWKLPRCPLISSSQHVWNVSMRHWEWDNKSDLETHKKWWEGGRESYKSLYLVIICIGGLHTKHQASVTYWKAFQKEYVAYENICSEPRNNQWWGELFILIISCFPLTISPASSSVDTCPSFWAMQRLGEQGLVGGCADVQPLCCSL